MQSDVGGYITANQFDKLLKVELTGADVKAHVIGKHVCRQTKLFKPCRSRSLYPSVLIEPVRQRLRMSVQANRLSGYF